MAKKTQAEDPVTIVSLDFENVKRIEQVHLEITDALTVIGGDNAQGKSSILDGIKWCLGGDRYKPTNPVREGAEKADAKLVLSNGWIVERYGKNGSLRVTTKDGRMGGQGLIKEFLNQFALDIQDFMDMSDKEKGQQLLKLIGVDLSELDQLEAEKYQERTAAGAEAKRLKSYADSLTRHADAPKEEVNAGNLAADLQKAIEHNAKVKALVDKEAQLGGQEFREEAELSDLKAKVKAQEEALKATREARKAAKESIKGHQQIDTKAIQDAMMGAETVNRKVRDNQKYEEAQTSAALAADKHADLEVEIKEIREARMGLLAEAKMPLDGLTVEDQKLLYKGQPWDNMSHSEQLRVAVAISSALEPKMGFVIIDKLEAFDLNNLKDFATWLKGRNLQAITTRVSKGDECSFIIANGRVQE